jgi:hypothetical protein
LVASALGTTQKISPAAIVYDGGMRWLAFVLLLPASSAHAYDVTTPEARRQSLLDYVAGRDDLSESERAAWDKAVRLTFGGKAMKDGTDEGVTVAKSVVAAAVFHRIDPKQAAKAAYDAYHDAYRWVPPPIAANWQILALTGRKPKASARELAYNFPKHFNEEIAPDLAAWWTEMLESGGIPEHERAEVDSVLAETRQLMRPMLLGKLWQGAELEGRLAQVRDSSVKGDLTSELASLSGELQRSFRGVGNASGIGDAKKSYYERYALLAKELGEKVAARPGPPPQRQPPPALIEPKPPPAPPRGAPMPDAFAPPPRQRVPESGHLLGAPLPGDPLIPPPRGYVDALQRTVESWLGTPYLFGGLDRRGVDCSGFTRSVFKESLAVELPRNSRAQYLLGTKIDQASLRPGDMIFFDTLERGQVTHVGVFTGEGHFAHASSSKGVTRAELNQKYYQRAFWGAKRILQN